MMSEPIALADLQVIGYADVLPDELLPRAVPPVYGLRREPGVVILPPYRLAGSILTDAFTTDGDEFERTIARGEATALPPFNAAPERILWIDAQGRPHYDRESVAVETLRREARRCIKDACAMLLQDDQESLGRALSLADSAMAADESCLDALLVKAFVFEEREDALTDELAQVAAVVNPDYPFKARLDEFIDRVRRQRVVRPDHRCAAAGRPVDRFGSTSSALAPAA